MHIPDGLLSAPVWIAGDAVAVVALAGCVRAAERQLSDRQVPLMGVMGAFVFAAQMVNFPIPGATSGHLLGAVLLAVLLGPAVASVVMFCVLLVQALLFQDGGITVLGVNFINMGLLGAFIAKLLVPSGRVSARPWRHYGLVFLAAWMAVEAGAVLCALELWLSGRLPLAPALAAMGTVHALIGVGEGLLTVAALRLLYAARPHLGESLS